MSVVSDFLQSVMSEKNRVKIDDIVNELKKIFCTCLLRLLAKHISYVNFAKTSLKAT